MAVQPVSVRLGNTTFTVLTLLSDSKGTTVRFTLTGLPGGKAGWREERPPSERRTPVLHDAQGQEYDLVGAWYGTGGSEEENNVSGGMNFVSLPADLTSVDLVVPQDYLVPPAVLAGSEQKEWVAHIELANPAESGLPQAVTQNVSATVHDVTLRVTASSVEPEGTVVLLDGEVPGSARVTGLYPNGSDPDEAVSLRDDLGRTYASVRQQSEVTFGTPELHKSLNFAPVAPGAKRLTLSVAALQVMEEGNAEITVPLAGKKVGDVIPLDRVVKLGQHEVLFKSATLQQNGPNNEPWLAVDVDLGPSVDGRLLSTFNVEPPQGSWGSSMGSRHGEQMDQFQIEIEPNQAQVTLKLSNPQLTVQGPWELAFPIVGEPSTPQAER